jgi:polyisoprenyl-teichoic acid--peptidoglycan teichoic acid transferase
LTEARPTPTPRRRAAVIATLLVAWIAGTTFGTGPAAPRANAYPVFQLQQAHAGYVPTLDGTSPIFILFLGSDARPGETITGQRSDSIHLVALNPARKTASILGFPRDSYVAIPDHGTNKINAAMTMGGPELVVQTVESLTGIKIDYWSLTWFDGFQAMINDIGGLTVDVPFPVDDHYAHANLEAGVQTLSGREALAFARARHALPTGDFGRSEDQGLLIASALAQFRKQFTKDPSVMFTWVGAGLRNVRTDVGLDQVMSLAFTSSTLNPKRTQNMVLPGTTGMAGGLSVVNLDQAALTAISNDLKDDGYVGKKNVPASPNAELIGEA